MYDVNSFEIFFARPGKGSSYPVGQTVATEPIMQTVKKKRMSEGKTKTVLN
jgi:hypothetical protein